MHHVPRICKFLKLQSFLSLFQQFQKLAVPFFTVELENRDDCNQIQAVLGEMTGATSVSIELKVYLKQAIL